MVLKAKTLFFYYISNFIKTSSIIMPGSKLKLIWIICVLHNPQGQFSGTKVFIFALKSTKIDDSFTFICKEILYHIFLCFYVIFCGLDPLGWIAINSKKQFMSSGDKPILNLKISVTNFGRFRYFVDFDIKIVLLARNSFQWIAFR